MLDEARKSIEQEKLMLCKREAELADIQINNDAQSKSLDLRARDLKRLELAAKNNQEEFDKKWKSLEESQEKFNKKSHNFTLEQQNNQNLQKQLNSLEQSLKNKESYLNALQQKLTAQETDLKEQQCILKNDQIKFTEESERFKIEQKQISIDLTKDLARRESAIKESEVNLSKKRQQFENEMESFNKMRKQLEIQDNSLNQVQDFPQKNGYHKIQDPVDNQSVASPTDILTEIQKSMEYISRRVEGVESRNNELTNIVSRIAKLVDIPQSCNNERGRWYNLIYSRDAISSFRSPSRAVSFSKSPARQVQQYSDINESDEVAFLSDSTRELLADNNATNGNKYLKSYR